MHFSTDQQDATTVFRLKESKLDSRNAGQLKAEFLILAQSDVETLIIDLSEVRQVDSAGLSALLLAHRQMAAHEGDVRLVGANSEIQSLLRVTQLDRIFPLFNTVDEALDAEPAFGDDDDDDDDDFEEEQGAGTNFPGGTPRGETPQAMRAPGAPSVDDIRAGAIAAGGSFGAAAISRIMMTEYEDELENKNILAFDDTDGFDEDDDDADDIDDEFEEDEDFADEVEEDDDEEADEEDAKSADSDDLVEEDDFEDDDFDEEELEDEDDEDDDF